MFVMTLRMLSTLCQGAGSLAAQLMRQSKDYTVKVHATLFGGLDIADTLRYLLLGTPDAAQENIEVKI